MAVFTRETDYPVETDNPYNTNTNTTTTTTTTNNNNNKFYISHILLIIKVKIILITDR